MMNSLQKSDTLQVNYASSDNLSSYSAIFPRKDPSAMMSKFAFEKNFNLTYSLALTSKKINLRKIIYPIFDKIPSKKNDSKNQSLYISPSHNLGILKCYALKLCNSTKKPCNFMNKCS